MTLGTVLWFGKRGGAGWCDNTRDTTWDNTSQPGKHRDAQGRYAGEAPRRQARHNLRGAHRAA